MPSRVRLFRDRRCLDGASRVRAGLGAGVHLPDADLAAVDRVQPSRPCCFRGPAVIAARWAAARFAACPGWPATAAASGTAAPGCPDGRADRTAAAVAASACWQILRLGSCASGLRCPLRTGCGLRVSAATGSGRGPASAARVQPAPPGPPRLLVQAVAELLPDVGHGRPLRRQGFLDSDWPVRQQSGARGSRSTASGACGSGWVHRRCCSAGASCLSASCMNRFRPHRSALVVALGVGSGR
jgi:hypothetical protein